MGHDATNWAWAQETQDKLVLLALAQHADQAGFCFPSRKTLAARCGCGVDTIDRAIRRLIADGFIRCAPRREAGGRQTSNGYTLLMPSNHKEEGRILQEGEGRTDAAGGAADCGRGGPQGVRPLTELSLERSVPLTPKGDSNARMTHSGKRASASAVSQNDRAEIDGALADYNRAANILDLARCSTLTDARARLLETRLHDLGKGNLETGRRQFRQALEAIPHCRFLAGKEKPKAGMPAFRLDLDRLLSTRGGLGDVLGRLCDLYDEHGAADGSDCSDSAGIEIQDRTTAAWQEAQAEELAAQRQRHLTGDSDAIH